MEFDAFNEGVEVGGLRSKNDIRILLCYLLCGVNAPLTRDDIISVMYENGFANYFEVIDALSGLTAAGSIDQTDMKPETYRANARTAEISRRLNSILPNTIRERAVACALNLLSAAKIERENKTEIRKVENGYCVECHVSGGDSDLMSFSLYVPDFAQARLVQRKFLLNPAAFYRMILALSTGNLELAENILNKTE